MIFHSYVKLPEGYHVMTMAHTNISIKQQEMGGLHQKEKQQSQWKQHGCLMLALLRKNCCLESITIRKKINHQYK